MRPRGLQKTPNDGPEASGGRLLSPRRVMLRLVELLGAIRDLQECSRELPGTLWGALGELSGCSWGALGTSWGALGRLLGAFWVRKSSSVAESLLFRESSSRLHGSIDFEVWRGRKWARNRSLDHQNGVGRGEKRAEGVLGAVQGDQGGLRGSSLRQYGVFGAFWRVQGTGIGWVGGMRGACLSSIWTKSACCLTRSAPLSSRGRRIPVASRRPPRR